MTIERLSSGSYRIAKMINGKRYRIVVDQKPTQKEAKALMQEYINGESNKAAYMTFAVAADKYIEAKSNVLSPSTIVGYRKIIRWLSDSFKNSNFARITQSDVQVEINVLAASHSPKSVRNTHGFISAVFKMYRPDFILHTTLPQKEVKEEYMPTDDDIKRLMVYFKDSEYEIAFRLALLGLRRSEVIALTYPDCLNGNMLTISQAVVKNEKNKYVKKGTKTNAGTREIYLPDDLVELIHNRGMFYEGHPGNIWKALDKAQKDLGIPHFKLHTLRHYYASTAHFLGIPDAYIMASGGWKSDATLKEVYRHALDEKKLEMDKQVADYMSKLVP